MCRYVEIDSSERTSLFEIIVHNQQVIWFDILCNLDFTDSKKYKVPLKILDRVSKIQTEVMFHEGTSVSEVVKLAYDITLLDVTKDKQRKQLNIFYKNLCEGISVRDKTQWLLKNLRNQFVEMARKEKYFNVLFTMRDGRMYCPIRKYDREHADAEVNIGHTRVLKALRQSIEVKEESFKSNVLDYSQHIDDLYNDYIANRAEEIYMTKDGVEVYPVGFGYYPQSRIIANCENLIDLEDILPCSFKDAKKTIRKTKMRRANLILLEDELANFRIALGMRSVNGEEVIFILHEVEQALFEKKEKVDTTKKAVKKNNKAVKSKRTALKENNKALQ